MIFLLILKDVLIAVLGAISYKGTDVVIEKRKKKKRELENANIVEETLIPNTIITDDIPIDNTIQSSVIVTTIHDETSELFDLKNNKIQQTNIQSPTSQLISTPPEDHRSTTPKNIPVINNKTAFTNIKRPPALDLTHGSKDIVFSPLSTKSATKLKQIL